jgi:hypothetical protein
MKPNLSSVTLIVVDCVDYDRARLAFDHCRACCDFGEAKLLTHFVKQEPDVIAIPKISSIEQYSHFIMRDLANYVETQHVLVAQWDGFVWHPELWDDEFLKYDYIGAPWPEAVLHPGVPSRFVVGNGGFSLRSKRLQAFLRDDQSITMHRAEDVAICQLNRAYLEAKGFTFAPLELAKKFSWECLERSPAFGVHARIRLTKNPQGV